ncbi:hypothetical protein CDD80_5097 [Ophiocordyceps camponoti-rufipedis]|uniref:Uncharacterized protein n=1 Tax=Ophiocordyceps camponoti-rufipedis TaxID=2004952 RepID=A0A2C5ZIT6_9HYPO|nr:hypothetical protein CDD80_5097 [Ophiocordyceps camponoti-rufipedis]
MSAQRASGAVFFLVSSILATAAVGDGAGKQIGSLQASMLAETSPLGIFMRKKLQEELGDQLFPPPYADVALDESVLPCAYERRVLSADRKDIRVNITSRIDFEIAPASEAAIIDIISSTARVDTSKSTWTTESFHRPGESNVSNASFSAGPWSASVSAESDSFTRGRSLAQMPERDVTVDVATTYLCPPRTLCRVETWTYSAAIRGNSTLVPMVDAQCYEAWARKTYVGFPPDYETDHVDFEAGGGWLYVYYAFRRLFQLDSRIMHTNLSIPSVHKQVPQWSDFGAPYYSISKLSSLSVPVRPQGERGGSPADYFQVLPSNFENDVWWADENKYDVRFNKHVRDVIRIPTLHYDGSPKRTQVMLEIPIPSLRRNGERLLEKGNHVNSTTTIPAPQQPHPNSMLPIASLMLLSAGLAASTPAGSSVADLIAEIERNPDPCNAFCRVGLELACKDFDGYYLCDQVVGSRLLCCRSIVFNLTDP